MSEPSPITLRGPDLTALARQLREGQISLEVALATGVFSTDLCYLFASHCAEITLQLAQSQGTSTDPESWQALFATRQWLAGQLGTPDWRAAGDDAWAAMQRREQALGQSLPHTDLAARQHRRDQAAYSTSRTVAWATSPNAIEAADMAAWCAADAARDHAPPPWAAQAWHYERSRQRSHLASFLEQFLQHRSRLLLLLQRRQQRREEELAHWRHDLQEAIY